MNDPLPGIVFHIDQLLACPENHQILMVCLIGKKQSLALKCKGLF
jgi:hypothetical protein